MKKLAIFRPGPHFPALDADALARTAQAYDPALHEAPLVIGHPADDAPAHGWVQSLDFSEPLLNAVPHQVDAQFSEQVTSGRYRKISASFYRPEAACNPKPGVWYLRHVGFLGARPPGVKGLPAVQFAAGETAEDYDTVEFAEPSPWLFNVMARLFRRQRDHLIEQSDLETADKVLPEYEIEELSREADRLAQQAMRSDSPSFTDPPADPGAQETPMDNPDAAARHAELDAREAALKEREQAFAQQEQTQAQRQAESFVEGLVGDGRVLPRDQAALTTLLTAIPEEATVNFAEGDSEVATPGPAGRFLRQFLSRLPQQVDFSERAAPGAADPPANTAGLRLPAGVAVDPHNAELHRRVVAFAEKHGVTYDEAVTRIADMEG